jgi:hypothetical protein
LLAPEKRKLVFIGQVGSGKTTALCHLLGLNYWKKEGQKEGYRELLTTGAGGVTLCRVIIKFSKHPYIKITPEEESVVEGWLEELAEYAVGQARNIKDNPPPNLPAEMRRALSNMTGYYLPEYDKKPALMDKAAEIVQRVGKVSDDFEESDSAIEELFQFILGAANLSGRKTHIFSYEGTEDWDEQAEWLNGLFEDINLMSRKEIPFPKLIEVGVPKIRPEILDHFDEFIDTKGLLTQDGQIKEAEDLLVRPDTVAAFCSPFVNAPESSVRKALEYYIGQDPEHRKDQYLLMVLPRNGVPEEVIGVKGPVGDFAEGCKIKIGGQIQPTLGEVLHIAPDDTYENGIQPNVFMYSAKKYLNNKVPIRNRQPLWKDNGDREEGEEKETNDSYSNFVFDKIIASIETRKKRLGTEVEKIKEKLKDIRGLLLLSAEEERAIERLEDDIQEIPSLKPAYDLWFENNEILTPPYLTLDRQGGFSEILGNIGLSLIYEDDAHKSRFHALTVRAFCKHQGVHSGVAGPYDFYARSEKFTQELVDEPFKKRVGELKNCLVRVCEDFKTPLLKEILSEQFQVLDDAKKLYLEVLKARVREEVENRVGEDEWNEAFDFRGTALTVKRIDFIMRQLANNFFERQVATVFQEKITQPLIEFFSRNGN